MKIVYVIDSHPENGGAPISTCLIATEFSNIYSSIELILPSQNRDYKLDSKIGIIELNEFKESFPSLVFNPFKTLKFAYMLRKKIRDLKPDIVHVQMPKSAWTVGLLKTFRLLPNELVYIYTDRDHMQSYKWPFKLISLLFIKPQFNEIVCLTKISADYWKRQIGKADVRVIPNSAGTIYESYDESMHNKLRRKFKVDENAFTVMFSGRMSVYKNWGLAKDIVLTLKDANIIFIFAISTMNKEQEKDFYQFRKEIKDAGVNHLMFQNISQENISNYYYMADLFVLTSNKESFGRTAIEAMSRKCVVIGRNTGGLPEVIGKDENILEWDIDKFCRRILFYKSNFNVLDEDKEWFLDRFESKYTVNANTEKHKLMYDHYNKRN